MNGQDDFRGVRVLVIGSGLDLNGRRLADAIDFSARWDVVARLNKYYGDPRDVGRRCELGFIRWRGWQTKQGGAVMREGQDWWPYDVRCGVRRWVVLNEFAGISPGEHDMTAAEAGVEKPSCGLLAVAWLLNRGARAVDVIGFGMGATGWLARKAYTNGVVDGNPHYDWEKEHRWMERQGRVHMI